MSQWGELRSILLCIKEPGKKKISSIARHRLEAGLPLDGTYSLKAITDPCWPHIADDLKLAICARSTGRPGSQPNELLVVDLPTGEIIEHFQVESPFRTFLSPDEHILAISGGGFVDLYELRRPETATR